MGLAGLERAKLPDLVPTGSILGGLAPAAASELGLLPGTPVVAGTGDLHSAAVGSGAVDDFDGHLYIGTSSWISCHVAFKKTDALTNIASFPSGLPGRYLVADEHETGGACLTWLRDNVLFPDDALSVNFSVPGRSPLAPKNIFATLNDVAASVPVGTHGVLFTPWLNGERSPVDDHTIRGGFHNLSLSSTRADMVRAVFEGVALNSAWLLERSRNTANAPSPPSPLSVAAPTRTCGHRSTLTPWVAPSARSMIRCWPTCGAPGCSRCSPSATCRLATSPAR